jgi:hypothetical protein
LGADAGGSESDGLSSPEKSLNRQADQLKVLEGWHERTMVVSDFGIFWPSSTYQGSIEKLRH